MPRSQTGTPTAPATADDSRSGGRGRELRTLLQELADHRGERPENRYAALAALLEDAKLDGDEESLIAAQRGLQRVYARQQAIAAPTPDHHVQRGRILQTLDELTWTLRRRTPVTTTAALEAGGHAERFLRAAAAHPGIYSGQIADLLDHARDDVISRVGSRLEAAGLVRKTRVGRRKHWYITPRGAAAIANRAQEPDR